MTGPVSVHMEGDVAWVTIDNPPVNATATPVRAGLAAAVRDVRSARVAVLRCAGRTFVAGGDMSEFDRPAEEPLLPDVVQAIEDSDTPFLALMHGNVLGGGLEIAMACAWRIAQRQTRFGLPEVNVGLIPGAGGSQRAPRLVGMAAAIDMACRGRIFDASAFLELGGVDALFDRDGEAAVRDFLAADPARPQPVSQRKIPASEPDLVANARRELERRAAGQKAPFHNLEALQWAALPFAEGQKLERKRHLELRKSGESRALRHVFFAERAVSRPQIIRGAAAREIAHAAIVGGGLMGSGIAASCLRAGCRVTVLETDEASAENARMRITKLVDGALKRGKIDQTERDAQLTRLQTTHDFHAAGDADLAIEAVFEDIATKRAVFERLSQVMDRSAILATNTSYLDPERVFAGTPHPERCLGLHFFSPAHVMRLLEIVRMPATGADTLATGFRFARKLGKVAVLAGICDGFIGNRMLSAYRQQADFMLADGALPHQVDAAMRSFGMPMGPYELQDLTGLQIAWANRKRQAETRDPARRYVPIADRLCEMGRLGQRSAKGWYRYDEGSRTPLRDPEVEGLIIDYSREKGIERRQFTPAQIAERLFAVLVNEGALIVEQGIAENDDAVDVVQVHGYGFPRWRGGPMHQGAQSGWPAVAQVMHRVVRQSPDTWTVSKRLS